MTDREPTEEMEGESSLRDAPSAQCELCGGLGFLPVLDLRSFAEQAADDMTLPFQERMAPCLCASESEPRSEAEGINESV